MSVVVLQGSDELIGTVPISNKRGCRIELVTVRSSYLLDPLTRILTSLPDHIRSHSVRSAIVTQILARQVNDSPVGRDTFDCTARLGCLYHHFGESLGKPRDETQIPLLSEDILKKHLSQKALNNNIDADMLLDIVRNSCERYDGSGYPNKLKGDEISLAARLTGLACTLDRLLITNRDTMAKNTAKIAKDIQDNGMALFGADAMDCYDQTHETIVALYLNHQQHLSSWT